MQSAPLDQVLTYSKEARNVMCGGVDHLRLDSFGPAAGLWDRDREVEGNRLKEFKSRALFNTSKGFPPTPRANTPILAPASPPMWPPRWHYTQPTHCLEQYADVLTCSGPGSLSAGVRLALEGPLLLSKTSIQGGVTLIAPSFLLCFEK